MLKSAIAVVLALSLLWASVAPAQELAPPARGTVVELTTSGAKEIGEFVEEIKIGPVTYWSLKSRDGGIVTLVKSDVISVHPVTDATPEPAASASPLPQRDLTPAVEPPAPAAMASPSPAPHPEPTPTAVVSPAVPETPAPVASASPTPTPAAGAEAAQTLEVRIHGSNTIGSELGPALARAMAAADGLTAVVKTPGPVPEIFDLKIGKAESDKSDIFHFATKGSGSAFTDLVAGATDVGMSSRRIKDDEVAKAQAAGLGDLQAPGAENVIALDGIVVLVSKKNPVNELTVDQLADIFGGKITDWSDVGGTPGPINVYVRPPGSGTRDTFENLVLAAKHLKFAESAKPFESSVELSEAVDDDARGIGFVGFAYARGAKALNIGTSCGKTFPAEPYTVRTEEYPLARRLYLYLPLTKRTPAAEAYVNFALSQAAQPVMDSTGFISLKIEPSSPAYALERGQYANMLPDVKHDSVPRLMEDMAFRIKGATRLSVTFRFNTEKADLDNRALEDIKRLADYVKQNGVNPKKLMIFGFADKTGSFDLNATLSQNRADAVKKELAKYDVRPSDANVKGLNVIAPVACSDSDTLLAKNRRVEIWIHK